MISKEDIYASRSALACFATVGLFWGGFAALVPLIKHRIGASDGEFGVALLVSAFGALFAMWFAPRLDRLLGARSLAVLAFAAGAAFLTPGLATGVAGFAAGMLAGAATTSALDVIMNARISALEAARKRPLMNFAHAVFSMAYAISALAAGLLREAGATAMLVFGVLALFNLILVREAFGDSGEVPTEQAEIAQKPRRLLLIFGGIVILIGFMVEQSTEGWSALHLERTLGGGAKEGAFGPAILGLTMALGRLGGQALVKHVNEVHVLALAALVCSGGAALAAFAPTLLLAYIGFAVLGVGVSVIAPMAYSHVGRNVADSARTATISRISLIGYSGFFIGPPIMGFVSEAFGLRASFASLAALLLLITFVFAPLLAHDQRRSHAR